MKQKQIYLHYVAYFELNGIIIEKMNVGWDLV